MSIVTFPFCVSHLNFLRVLNFCKKTHVYLAKIAGVLVGGLGWQKMRVSSYNHVLICSFYFVCEPLLVCQFCALMPKISKENFAEVPSKSYQGYYWTPKRPKIGQNSKIDSFLPVGQNKPLAEGRSPPQELKIGPRSGPYPLVKTKIIHNACFLLRPIMLRTIFSSQPPKLRGNAQVEAAHIQ